MSATFQKIPVVSQNLSTVPVGIDNPIDLPCIDFRAIVETIGEKKGQGNFGTIYKVKNSISPRVYKIIPQDKFINGDEIRISKIAGDLGVSPFVYDVFLASEESRNVVVIEMDDAGIGFHQLMNDLDDEREIQHIQHDDPETKKILQERKRASQAYLKEMAAQGHRFCEQAKEVKPITFQETLDNLYPPNREAFYYELFSKIKILAENNIAWRDGNIGNIMPNIGAEKGMQLIDFSRSCLKETTQAAALESLKDGYTYQRFIEFKAINNLSNHSVQLINWFNSLS